ncbi:MAG: ATP-dependent DNA helicase [Thermoplasmataceae archaeon]
MVSVAETIGSNVIIIANPGTGKTEELANYAVDLIRSGVTEDDILCLTFTNKAADEMLSRIVVKMSDAGLDPYRAYNMEISTFHSYAYRYLSSKGISISMASNNLLRYAVFRSFKKDKALNYSTDYILEEIVPKVENAIRYVKAFGVLPVDVDPEKAMTELKKFYSDMAIKNITEEENLKFLEYFLSAYSSYEKMKKERKGVLDHNDLLIMFLKIFNGPKYRYVLVDELQDVSEMEAEIALRSGEKIFAVGDRKQSIFGFQGGSLKNFEKIKDMDGIRHITMGENHRSTGNIISYSKEFFLSNIRNPKLYAELSEFRSSSADEGEKVSVVSSTDPEIEAANLAISLVSGLNQGEDVAVITRTNSQLADVSRVLDRKGIQYTSTNGSSSNLTAKNDIMDYISSIFFDDPESKLRAIFTPFSGVPLKQAFSIAEKTRRKIWANEVMDSELLEFPQMAKKPFTREGLNEIFTRVILPISVSIGREYFSTAMSVFSSVKDFFTTSSDLTLDAFMDFLTTTDEEYDAPEKPSRLVLTTVHKAKGMEFTNVIYVPRDSRRSLGFVDAVAYSIIRATKGIDVREELYDESERIDFVALTRAKKTLSIVGNEASLRRYYVPGYCEKRLTRIAEDIQPGMLNFDEAYSYFVNGHYEEARSILTSDSMWLKQQIHSFFRSKNRLSYSLVKATKEPYRFLKNYIISIFFGTEAMKLGSRIHENAQKDFLKEIDESEVEGDERVFLENTRHVNEAICTKYSVSQTGSEESITLPISAVLPYMASDSNVMFTGKLDAVFSSSEGKIVILDYKTDKTRDYSSDHMQQLSLYAKLFAVKHGIKEENISLALGYIGLRGKVNTGEIGYGVIDSAFSQKYLNKFIDDLNRYMEYRKNPDLFIADLLAQDENETLFRRIRDLLSSDSNGSRNP